MDERAFSVSSSTVSGDFRGRTVRTAKGCRGGAGSPFEAVWKAGLFHTHVDPVHLAGLQGAVLGERDGLAVTRI